MIETPVPFASRYAEDLKLIRAINAVKWAKIKGQHLYVCTRANRLRHWLQNRKHKYLPQIVMRFSLENGYAQPRFMYLWGGWAKDNRPHPTMDNNIGNWYQEYEKMGCMGDNVDDYRKARVNGGILGGVQSALITLQTIY